MEEFMVLLIPIIGTVLIFGLPFFAIYLGLRISKNRHAENMDLIKQGIIPPSRDKKPTPNKYRSLRNGFICLGVALGIIVALILESNFDFAREQDFLMLGSSILFFMGVAYVAYYLIIHNKKDVDSDEEYE